uniref:TenA family protein n=1 Tax=Desertifilum tharense IPPAS B-1220 TaxID=1781255 RepID=A0ACD5GWU3_9CYAN
MSVSEILWQAHHDIAQACLQHPFVRAIANGTLPKSIFAHYVGQDAFFLESFARAYSIAAVKAPDWEAFTTFHALAAGVLNELKLHRTYAQTWGVHLQTIEPTAATRRYTDFLLATSWSSQSSLTAVAMSPCMRLYAFLGQELSKIANPESAYIDWITTYSSAEFEHLARQLENLVNRYLMEPHSTVHSTYRYALLCERDFFESAWRFEEQTAKFSG